jgi:Lon-like protease
MRSITPARLAAAGLFLLFIAALILWLAPADGYDLRLVDPAHPVAPLVRLPEEKPARGGGAIYFVDVRERPAHLLERILPWTRPEGASLVPSPPISTTLERSIGRQDMTDSQKIAAVVALGHLGYKVKARLGGVSVLLVQNGAPASKVLRPGDVIVAAAGREVRSVKALRKVLARRRPGEVVTIRYRRGSRIRTAMLRTVADPVNPKRAIIGVTAEDQLQVRLPFRVVIDTGSIGGPSAGLAFALDILQELGQDVAHGRKVAATGALDLDGSVEPIGGVKQKTLGAREAGVDVFLVPAGGNAGVARRYADGLRVIPVKTFPQALRALATLGPKT